MSQDVFLKVSMTLIDILGKYKHWNKAQNLENDQNCFLKCPSIVHIFKEYQVNHIFLL